MRKIIRLAALIALVILGACTPVAPPQQFISPVPVNTSTSLPSPTIEPTQTPKPTATSTATSIPTPDYSLIKFAYLYANGTTETVFVFNLNGIRGMFHGEGNKYLYTCKSLPDNADKLYCTGDYQASGRNVVFQLFDAGRKDPVQTMKIGIPSYIPPTPIGMTCEIEPLWVAPLTGSYGCYAVTCYIGGQYYGGTEDTCTNPWPWWPVP